MGVDCRILLPPDARIRDVADVIGILAGLNPEWDDSIPSVSVPGATAKPSSLAECAEITIVSKNGEFLVDGETSHWLLFHWEPSEESGMHLLMPHSTAFWIALGKKLVSFFGGSIDYNDCDSKDVDYRAKKPRRRNNPTVGKPWDDFQKAMFNIKPLTEKDLEKAEKYAAYKRKEN